MTETQELKSLQNQALTRLRRNVYHYAAPPAVSTPQKQTGPNPTATIESAQSAISDGITLGSRKLKAPGNLLPYRGE